MGLTITVNLQPGLYNERKIVGEAQYLRQTVALDPNIQVPTLVEHTFYHEKVHWILFAMGEDELRTNEKFVDMFAFLLHQADTTQGDFYTLEDLKELASK
jgi:hypothetical protein